MPRPVTLFTGQWADLPLEAMCAKAKDFGYDGLELACWGDHFNVTECVQDEGYRARIWGTLEKNGLKCWAISNHLVGQAVCDPIDERHGEILPEHIWREWADGRHPEKVQEMAAEEMKSTARAAARFGVKVVNGFTGSSIWHKVYGFPPVSEAEIAAGFRDFADRWNPILDVFDECGVRFALEVHPSEIAFDLYSAERALEAVGGREAFGFNFDPSHFAWQGVDPVKFIERFPDRIYHVHMKDCKTTLDGMSGILASHLPFGDHRRGWDFRSLGRGDIDFDAIIRALNRIGYEGPLSVEWEDSGMDREHGAIESCEYVRGVDFPPAGRGFEAGFAE